MTGAAGVGFGAHDATIETGPPPEDPDLQQPDPEPADQPADEPVEAPAEEDGDGLV